MASAKPVGSRKGIDAHVGSRIVERRRALALTRGELAAALGVSGEQLRRYEAGVATVTIARLHEIGATLAVPVEYFYAAIDERMTSGRKARRGGEPSAREVARVVRYCRQLGDVEVRQRFIALIDAISAAEVGQTPTAARGSKPPRRALNGHPNIYN
jgi:transcriptional regulator with XRE-family HTH domain